MNRSMLMVAALLAVAPTTLIGQKDDAARHADGAKQVKIMARVFAKGLARASRGAQRWNVPSVYYDLMRGIKVNEEFDRMNGGPQSGASQTAKRVARGTYLPGVGAHFEITARVPTAAVVKETKGGGGSKPTKSDLWDQSRRELLGGGWFSQEVQREQAAKPKKDVKWKLPAVATTGRQLSPEAVKKVRLAVSKLLATHGGRITALGEDDRVLVTIRFSAIEGATAVWDLALGVTLQQPYWEFRQANALPTRTVVLQVSCRDLAGVRTGDLTVDEVIRRTRVTAW
ncbi:MAG: hypothetical protein CMJ83_05705 [Planctomycetes bacterium]|nr:hypothetical protein [Planctomycetota bacterium]